MNCFGLIKYVTGILLALALLFVAGAGAARYVITRLTTPPPKPIFAEEQTQPQTDASVSDEANGIASESASTEDEAVPEEAEIIIEEGPKVFDDEPEAAEEDPSTEEAEVALDPDAYNARVTQPIGMVLRQGPSQGTTRIGGIYYNDEVIILGESNDGQWQNVRLPGSGVEGWIKAGNVERID